VLAGREHRLEHAGEASVEVLATQRVEARRPSWYWLMTPASRRTLKWCVQVDFDTGRPKLPQVRRSSPVRRTSALIATAALSVITLALIGAVESFWAVVGLIVVWGLLFAATMPIRQTYLNGLIPSRQRATIISFDSLMSSSGGVWAQPVLGRAADVWGYAPSHLIGAGISALAVPFLALSRREDAPADTLDIGDAQPVPQPA
jgi:MFS family permease